MEKLGIIITTATLGLSLSAISIQPAASASAWTKKALPHRLRHTWYSKYGYRNTIHFYAHSVKFKGNGAGIARVKKWRYIGNGKYQMKLSDRSGYSFGVHYLGRNHITAYTMDHSYFR
ncbi:hypothetical protein [Lentilactobacillus senioris]|uniref:hypothetical protein n=1 Tax=Lentilactobacillus senioris TaxID=931534 RepID=UPI003D267622